MWVKLRSSQSTSGRSIGSGPEVDFHWKSNYHRPNLALENGDDGEMHSEGRSNQDPNLRPILIGADKLLYPWR